MFMSTLQDCREAGIIFWSSFLLCFPFDILGSNGISIFFSASAISIDTIKLSKNFNMSQESMKVTLADFKANKTVADVTREVF